MDKVRKFLFITLIIIVPLIIYISLKVGQDTIPSPSNKISRRQVNQSIKSMLLTSPAFNHNQSIPPKYTCDGENISPPLRISAVPTDAKSLVLVMDDPDVPKSIRPDGMWDHWLVFNIPPETKEIPEGREPSGIHGRGTGGNSNYMGPCPPDRQHRYFFKLYALDTKLDLPAGSSKKQIEEAMSGHILEQTELIGLYTRKRS